MFSGRRFCIIQIQNLLCNICNIKKEEEETSFARFFIDGWIVMHIIAKIMKNMDFVSVRMQVHISER